MRERLFADALKLRSSSLPVTTPVDQPLKVPPQVGPAELSQVEAVVDRRAIGDHDPRESVAQ